MEDRLKDFEFCRTVLDRLGIQYNVRTNEPTFQNVKLPLTDEEWVSLVSNSGAHYIGGCCGNSSSTQDRVCQIFRFEGGWAGKELREIAEESISHDGEESPFFEISDSFLQEKWPLLVPPDQRRGIPPRDPWMVISYVWHLTKHHLRYEIPYGVGDHISPVRKALRIMRIVPDVLTWEHLFGDRAPPTSQEKANREAILARFVPALDFLRSKVDELSYGGFVGFALIDTNAGPNAIAENGRGLCLYATDQEIEDILKIWTEQDEEREHPKRNIRTRFSVRPVRVDLSGIVFTDTNETYDFESKTPS